MTAPMAPIQRIDRISDPLCRCRETVSSRRDLQTSARVARASAEGEDLLHVVDGHAIGLGDLVGLVTQCRMPDAIPFEPGSTP
jgi:hypothetical protein